jgi:hypothetical protein
LREVAIDFPLPLGQPVAVAHDNRRITTVESNFHRVIEHAAEHPIAVSAYGTGSGAELVWRNGGSGRNRPEGVICSHD